MALRIARYAHVRERPPERVQLQEERQGVLVAADWRISVSGGTKRPRLRRT
jgi:hypothetical protein